MFYNAAQLLNTQRRCPLVPSSKVPVVTLTLQESPNYKYDTVNI